MSEGITEGRDTLLFETDSLYRLGVVRQPFHRGAVFEDAALATQMNVAISLLQSGERLLVIQGGPGLGKTTFLERIRGQEATGLEPVRFTGTPETHLAELLGALATSAGEAPTGPVTREQVVTHVRGSRRAGSRPVLLIDDAHQIPAEELRALLGLFEEMAGRGEGFSVVLTTVPDPAPTDWRALLPSGMPAERLHEANLFPFSEGQTRAYLAHRQKEAGGDGEWFSEAELQAIHERSGGRPDRIHEEAFDLLSRRLSQRKEARPGASGAAPRSAGGRFWVRAGLAVGAGVVTAGATVAWFVSTHMTPEPAVDDELEIPGELVEDDEEVEVTEEAGAVVEGDDIDNGVLDPDEADQPFGLPLPEHYSFSRSRDSADRDLADSDAPGDEEAELEEALQDEIEPITARQTEEASEEGVRWVQSADRNRYTIQLLAAGSPETLKGYAEHHGVADEIELVRTVREGQAWYLLLYGDHPDRDTAREVLERLDEELRDRGPWIRTLGSVRDALEE